jgi:hypothetical protein
MRYLIAVFFAVLVASVTQPAFSEDSVAPAIPKSQGVTADKNKASCLPKPGSATQVAIDKALVSRPNAPPAGAGTSNISGADVFSKFSTTATNGSTQATVQIVSGYINAWMKSDGTLNCGLTNAISVEVTATAAVTTSSFSDYAREEMLGRRAGIVNIYFNPFAGRDANNPYYMWNDRALASDHIYIASPFQTIDSKLKTTARADSWAGAWDEALSFYSFGFGGRAVKKALQGSATAAVGTVYVGFGIDGPFHDFSNTDVSNSASGGLSFELYLTGNKASRNALNSMFGITSASSSYATYGAQLTFWATGKLFFSLEYDKGIGSFGERVLRDASLFRFGYGNPKSTSTANQGGGGK